MSAPAHPSLPAPAVRPPPPIDGILDAVGRTPLVRVAPVDGRSGATVLAKLEFLGPANSIFDRPAASVVWKLARAGHLRDGTRIFAAGGGDAVISLAMACSASGLAMTAVVPKRLHVERKKALVDYGAKLVSFDDSALPPGEAWKAAQEHAFGLASAARGLYVDLWEGAEVVGAFEVIGRELLEALGKAPACTVVGLDLGAAPTGVSRGLGGGKVVAVEPANARVGSGGPFAPHLLGGLVPAGSVDALDRARIKEFEAVSDEEAWARTLRLSREQGVLAGIASGAVLVAAERRAASLPSGATVVAVLPDSGERRFMLDPYFAPKR